MKEKNKNNREEENNGIRRIESTLYFHIFYKFILLPSLRYF